MRLVGVNLTTGAVPVPVSDIDCGDPVALSATLTLAMSEPLAAGAKVTVIVHLEPAATLAPQVLVCKYELAPVPVMLTPGVFPLPSVSAAVPVLLSVMACVFAAVPTSVPVKVRVAGARLTAGAVPVPANPTDCVEPVALSAMLTSAASEPVAAGVKVTVMLQDPLAATLAPQLLLCANEAAPVPVMLIPGVFPLPSINVALPVLFSVTLCVAAGVFTSVPGKVRLVADKFTAGAMPVPPSVTVCGDPAALSAMLSFPASEPPAPGLKVTVIVQEPLAARLVPHLLVCVNALALVPETVIAVLLSVNAALPWLVSVIGSADVEPTATLPKLRLLVDRLATALEPVPLSETDCGELAALSAMVTVPCSAPIAAGLKVTVMAQVPFTARLVVHVFVWVNELSPLKATGLVHVSAAVPEFVTVIFCVAAAVPTAVLAKVRPVVESVTTGATVPIPEIGAVCGDPVALSATLT